MVACALSLGQAWAQELPKWADKARKAVFSVITYNADNKILNTGNGFYKGTDINKVSGKTNIETAVSQLRAGSNFENDDSAM